MTKRYRCQNNMFFQQKMMQLPKMPPNFSQTAGCNKRKEEPPEVHEVLNLDQPINDDILRMRMLWQQRGFLENIIGQRTWHTSQWRRCDTSCRMGWGGMEYDGMGLAWVSFSGTSEGFQRWKRILKEATNTIIGWWIANFPCFFFFPWKFSKDMQRHTKTTSRCNRLENSSHAYLIMNWGKRSTRWVFYPAIWHVISLVYMNFPCETNQSAIYIGAAHLLVPKIYIDVGWHRAKIPLMWTLDFFWKEYPTWLFFLKFGKGFFEITQRGFTKKYYVVTFE